MAKYTDSGVELYWEEKAETMDTEKPAHGPFSIWSRTGLLIFPEGINTLQSNLI